MQVHTHTNTHTHIILPPLITISTSKNIRGTLERQALGKGQASQAHLTTLQVLPAPRIGLGRSPIPEEKPQGHTTPTKDR